MYQHLLITLAILFISLSDPLIAAELHRGNGAEPETLDIHKSSGVTEANIQRDLFEGLVTEAADGQLIPGAAESWKISADARTYLFKLREDGHWSNGDPVVAEDFVYAIQRALNPKTASEYNFILWPIKNAEAFSKGEIQDIHQLGIRALSPNQLEIQLTTPVPYFLSLLTHHMAYPLLKKVLEQHGTHWTRPGKLISNGPYQLTEWVPQSHIKLEKNPHYRDAEKISLDRVIYYPSENQNTAMKRFRAGALDITDDVPSDQIRWVKKNLPEAFHNSPYIGTYYYAFNLQRAPFKNHPQLREALSLAIDRDILTEKVTRAGEIPAWSWVPPGILNYQQQPHPAQKLDRKTREAQARALYKKSGYSKNKPLEVELLYNTSENHKKIAIAIAAMWKKVLGVKTRFRNEEWKVYLSSRKQRDFTVIRAGWIGDYNDAYNFLSLFKSDVGEMNPSGYKNPKFDQLIKQAETENNQKKRAELMQQAEKVLLADTPILPIYFYTTQHLVSPKVQGWKDNIMDIHPSRFLSIQK
ncbi:MAG TPA: peptide ABC transporter substrate-binding protein [Gammaproteobacteria bacterium]|nr:peptide ABC transporter substrate-binding protein [Gammaproteobacteria bacterium]